MSLDSNTFYRITNSVLGNGFSLDVVNAGNTPTGLVDITPSGLFSGQVWQFINPTQPNKGPYYLSTSFLGAAKKLDLSIGANHTYIPFLKNFTAMQDQTWIVKPHNDTVSGGNTTTYSIEPTYFNGSKALTANSTTKQPFLDVPGGGFQHWVLTPVMQINDASFSTSALWAMATQTGTSTATGTSGIKSTGLPSSSSSSQAGQTPPIALPKSALIAIILAPVTLVVALLIFTCIFLYYRRKACKRKQAAALEEKLENPWRDSGPHIYYGSRPPFATAARAYTASIASSGNFASSTQPDDFAPLDPRPPSRPTSWIRGRDNQPFFGASALGNLDERLQSPQSPTSPLPAELAAGSRRGSAEVEQMPRLSPLPTRKNETPNTQRSPSAQSVQRSLSLISRWKV